MKTILAAVMAVILMVSGLVRADDFSDFRIPTHRVYGLSGDIYGTYDWERQTDHSQNSDNRRSKEWNGWLEMNGFWLHDSDPLRAYFSAEGGTDGHRRTTEQEPNYTDGTHNSIIRATEESWRMNGDLRYYPWQTPFGFGGGLSANSTYEQGWYSETGKSVSSWDNSTTINIFDSELSSQSYSISGHISAGQGRVRDATVVYDIHMLEGRLLKAGALIRPLSAQARQQLAELFYFQGRYKSIKDRPAKYFWEEVEKILAQDGGLTEGGLDAYSIYRIAEPNIGSSSEVSSQYSGFYYQNEYSDLRYGYRSRFQPAASFTRNRGWFAGLRIEGSHDHRISRESWRDTHILLDNDQVISSRNYSYGSSNYFSDDLGLGPQVEYHLPIGYRLQVDAASRYILLINNFEQAFDFNNSCSAIYMLADRWRASASVSHNRSTEGSGPGDLNIYSQWNVSIDASLTYYIEDRVALSLALDQYQSGTYSRYVYEDSEHKYKYYRSNGTVWLGLTYRFLGGLDAPGLGIRERLPSLKI